LYTVERNASVSHEDVERWLDASDEDAPVPGRADRLLVARGMVHEEALAELRDGGGLALAGVAFDEAVEDARQLRLDNALERFRLALLARARMAGRSLRP
jgi:hypothetical protein